MGLFEGKTTTERNKIIAAGGLGLVAIVSLYLAFGGSFFGGSSTTATNPSASPTPRRTATAPRDTALPTAAEQDFAYQTTPVDYRPGGIGAPDPGRNIFAFYEPPVPTPFVPPPYVPPPVPTPTPIPTPPILVTTSAPQTIYAGSKDFQLVVQGDRFTPDSRIYINQREVPTVFVSPQRLTTQISTTMVAQQGPRQIMVQTPDGTLYSNQIMLSVEAPPKPAVQYIGIVGRARFNNDTAYFSETGRPNPFSARLNDVVGGRFRLVDIAAESVVFEDTQLGFRHRIEIAKAAALPSAMPGRGGGGGFVPFNPTAPGGARPASPPVVRPTPRPQATPAEQLDVDDNEDEKPR